MSNAASRAHPNSRSFVLGKDSGVNACGVYIGRCHRFGLFDENGKMCE
ncbi:hypothetical protein [Burkholderia pyrrocinia]|uniref:Uncharacterized protein n=1 Tax=Burkholderia pyrrocinia TaxID=60550 RepID=A0ABZ3BNQ4_BURPY